MFSGRKSASRWRSDFCCYCSVWMTVLVKSLENTSQDLTLLKRITSLWSHLSTLSTLYPVGPSVRLGWKLTLMPTLGLASVPANCWSGHSPTSSNGSHVQSDRQLKCPHRCSWSSQLPSLVSLFQVRESGRRHRWERYPQITGFSQAHVHRSSATEISWKQLLKTI